MKVLQFLIAFSILLIVYNLFSLLEKAFRSKSTCRVTIVKDAWSLRFFKIGRLTLLLFGSLEQAFSDGFGADRYVPGAFLILLGMTLRCCAIYSLGPFWSYDIALYENHQVVRTGIYRYLTHPAYIGNIYLVGILISLNSLFTAAAAFLFIAVFYAYRTRTENKLLLRRRSAHEELEIIPWNIKESV